MAAQNVFDQPNGAFTGEISVAQLKDSNIRWTLLGHSERRTILREEDEFVACKTKAALSGGIGVILCCGESLEEREANTTVDVVTRQLAAVNKSIGKDGWKNVVVAYEPIWAIGTGKVATTGMMKPEGTMSPRHCKSPEANPSPNLQNKHKRSTQPSENGSPNPSARKWQRARESFMVAVSRRRTAESWPSNPTLMGSWSGVPVSNLPVSCPTVVSLSFANSIFSPSRRYHQRQHLSLISWTENNTLEKL